MYFPSIDLDIPSQEIYEKVLEDYFIKEQVMDTCEFCGVFISNEEYSQSFTSTNGAHILCSKCLYEWEDWMSFEFSQENLF